MKNCSNLWHWIGCCTLVLCYSCCMFYNCEFLKKISNSPLHVFDFNLMEKIVDELGIDTYKIKE